MTGQTKSPKMSAHDLNRLARFRAMAEQHIKRVGRAIQLRREELGWSRPQLARAIPVADKTVERWETGKTGGASEQLDRIAKVMSTSSAAMIAAAMKEERDAGGEPQADSPLDRLSGTPSESELAGEVRELQSETAELRSELSEVRSDLQLVLSLLQRGERDQGDAGT